MKTLRDLRPCDACAGPHHGLFYVIRFSVAVVHPDAVNQFVGMDRFFGGRASFELVENFTPMAGQAIQVAMDHADTRELATEAIVCTNCYCGPLLLPALAEGRRRQPVASSHAEGSSQPAPTAPNPPATEETPTP